MSVEQAESRQLKDRCRQSILSELAGKRVAIRSPSILPPQCLKIGAGGIPPPSLDALPERCGADWTDETKIQRAGACHATAGCRRAVAGVDCPSRYSRL